ncbi:MAG: PAS domain S-box protein [Oscillatoriales cyanobacterium C42_A2020_001]|nr:PAS domain S-box protein [Leptolyngbyaceae cyanobacterium C42_A2020_001]
MSNHEQATFTQNLHIVQQRTQELYKNACDFPWRQSHLIIVCLEELRLALEGLQIAEEELHQQNQALLAARQVIEDERQRYRELFEFAPDGYVVTDIYGIMQEGNCTAAALFNVAQTYLVGKPLGRFVPESQRQLFHSVLSQLPTIHRIQEWEIPLCGRDMETFDAAITVETVRNSNGKAIALRWLLRDISARKQAEHQLRKVQLENTQLLEADRLKSQFMATISHELRTPMNAILGFSELLRRNFHQQHDPKLTHMIESIARNGKHLLLLIEEILDFSKLKANSIELQLELFDLVQLAASTVDELQSLAEQKSLKLQFQVTQPSIMITNDPNRLRQVLTNLLSNAIKFTETGSVTLAIPSPADNLIQIKFQDTGIGIAPSNQKLIFQEFWQVNQTTTRRHTGTGLGLTIVRALVELMQGVIAVDSQLGRGTTFTLKFSQHLRASRS